MRPVFPSLRHGFSRKWISPRIWSHRLGANTARSPHLFFFFLSMSRSIMQVKSPASHVSWVKCTLKVSLKHTWKIKRRKQEWGNTGDEFTALVNIPLSLRAACGSSWKMNRGCERVWISASLLCGWALGRGLRVLMRSQQRIWSLVLEGQAHCWIPGLVVCKGMGMLTVPVSRLGPGSARLLRGCRSLIAWDDMAPRAASLPADPHITPTYRKSQITVLESAAAVN